MKKVIEFSLDILFAVVVAMGVTHLFLMLVGYIIYPQSFDWANNYLESSENNYFHLFYFIGQDYTLTYLYYQQRIFFYVTIVIGIISFIGAVVGIYKYNKRI